MSDSHKGIKQKDTVDTTSALLCYLAVICEDDLHQERGGPTASAKAAAGPLCSIGPS